MAIKEFSPKKKKKLDKDLTEVCINKPIINSHVEKLTIIHRLALVLEGILDNMDPPI